MNGSKNDPFPVRSTLIQTNRISAQAPVVNCALASYRMKEHLRRAGEPGSKEYRRCHPETKLRARCDSPAFCMRGIFEISVYRVSFNIIRSIHDCTHWRGGICVADRISNERDLFRPYGSRSEHKRGISPNNIARFLFPASRSVLFSRSNAECTNVNCHLPLNEHWRVGASARFIDVLSKPIASVERRWRVSFKKRNHTQQREAVQWWHSSLSLSLMSRYTILPIINILDEHLIWLADLWALASKSLWCDWNRWSLMHCVLWATCVPRIHGLRLCTEL